MSSDTDTRKQLFLANNLCGHLKVDIEQLIQCSVYEFLNNFSCLWWKRIMTKICRPTQWVFFQLNKLNVFL